MLLLVVCILCFLWQHIATLRSRGKL